MSERVKFAVIYTSIVTIVALMIEFTLLYLGTFLGVYIVSLVFGSPDGLSININMYTWSGGVQLGFFGLWAYSIVKTIRETPGIYRNALTLHDDNNKS